jgi:glycosidase
MGDELCHSATNYECYKGMHSALNSMNLFEIIHSLLRQFGPENWTLYRGKHLLSFVDNHDVSRIASVLQRPEHMKLIYTLMFGMPGIPTVYYGSEWGTKADKSQGDPALRPCFEAPEWTELTDTIAALCKAKNSSKALNYGDFKSLVLTNRQCIFERECDGDRALVVINADENGFHADFNARAGKGVDLISGKEIDFGGGLDIPAYTGYIISNLC